MSYLWMQCKLAHAAATDAMCGCCCIERQLLWYIVAVSCRRKAGLSFTMAPPYISRTFQLLFTPSSLPACLPAAVVQIADCIDQVGVAEHAGG